MEWFQRRGEVHYPCAIPLQLTKNGVHRLKPNKSLAKRAILNEWDASVLSFSCEFEVVAVDFMGLVYAKHSSIKNIDQLAIYWAKRLEAFTSEQTHVLVICFDKNDYSNFAKTPTQVALSLWTKKEGRKEGRKRKKKKKAARGKQKTTTNNLEWKRLNQGTQRKREIVSTLQPHASRSYWDSPPMVSCNSNQGCSEFNSLESFHEMEPRSG